MRWRWLLLWTSLAVCGCLYGIELRGQMIGGEASRQAGLARAQQRSLRFVARRGVRPGGTSAARYAAALAQRQVAAQGHGVATPQAWTEIGPLQVSTQAYGLVTGRVTSLAADPSDTSGNTLYVGSTGGGVWKSTNAAGSGTFSPMSDRITAFTPPAVASLSVGAITVQPGGTGVVLAGTGDPNDATDSYYGVGILRSTDSGQNWSVITIADLLSGGSEETFLGNAFAGFAWSSSNPNLVVAAVTDSTLGVLEGEQAAIGTSILGLYYSEDAGATWSLATLEDGGQVIEANDVPVSGGGNAATSVVWNPVRQRFYAAIRYHGYYESTDGASWTRLANQPGPNFSMQMCPSNPNTPGSQACPLYRGVLAVQSVTGDLFALTVDRSNNDQGLWRDVCNAGSGGCANPVVQFGRNISDTALDTSGSSGVIAQGSYDLTLAAVPSQQDTLLFAGTLDIFRCSLANRCAWRNTTNDGGCAAARVAPSQHALESSFGAQGLMYFGNDGGVWRTTDAVNQQPSPCTADDANHFQNLNGGLGSLSEVEDVAISSDKAGELLAALGALGTAGTGSAANIWPQVLNAEGEQVAIDPNNDQNWFASAVGGQIDECSAGSACAADLFQAAIGSSQPDGDLSLQSIPAPWLFDPASATNLLVGTCRVWRGPANGEGWGSADVLSTMLDGQQETTCNENFQNAEIRSLSAAPAGQGAEQIYAGMAGVPDGGGLVPGHLFTGNIRVAQQGAVAWMDMTESPVVNVPGQTRFNPDGNDISSVYADPHDPSGMTVYATVQGYPSIRSSVNTIYGSTDGGQQWSDLSTNLPAVPANSVVVDPNDARIVYVATDVGVWVTTDIDACNQGQDCWDLMGTGLPLAPVTKLLTFNSGGDGMLVAATYGRGIWEIPLLTAGTESTTATAAPGTLTFAPQPMQTTSAAQNVTVTVTGSVSLQVTGYAATGDFSVTEGACAGAMGLSSSCVLQVSFTPTAAGARSGILSIYGNVPGGQLTVLLSGTGTGAAAMVLNPSSVNFGTALIGGTTPAQNLTVSNTGDVPATITTIAASGDFSIVANTCGTSLAPESGCTVAVAFAPSASGARTGALKVTDSAGTQSVPLSGTGQTPATDAIAPATLSFAAQQVGTSSGAQTITLANSGDSPLNLIAATVSGDFRIVNDCGVVLVGHSACALLVTFAPSRVGAESGQVSITDALRTQTVALSGTGQAGPGISVAPDPLAFGGYGVGATTSPQVVTLTNNGGSAISGVAASVTAGFSVASNSCTGTLAVGSACQFGVVFSPTTDGAASGTFLVQIGSSSQSYSVPVSGFGDDFTLAVAGATSQTVTSGETVTYSLSTTPLSGTSGQIAFSCSGVPAGASCTLNPSQGAVSGQAALDATLTIVTGQTGTSAASGKQVPFWPEVFYGLIPCMGIGLRRLRRKSLARLAGLLFLAGGLGFMTVAGLSGCGVSSSGGSSSNSGSGTGGGSQITPSGSYPITVTASMPGLQKTVQVTLIVE
jgi:Abnormal spindle-like microcephaly-assoc'd, ASPM-SPD-2-Hydin